MKHLPYKTILVLMSLLATALGPVFSESSPPVINPQKIRAQPKPIFSKPDLIVEWQDALDDCSPVLICVQGGLYNQGGRTAGNVRLRVEIGAINLSKPRVVKLMKVDQSEMNPGDRQDFYFELERKTPYKDRKGKSKVIEVGKYNFRIIPLWSAKKN